MNRRSLLVILIAIVLGCINLNDRIGPNGDDAAYIEFARGIMQGHGLAWMHPPVPEPSGYRTFTLPLFIIPFEYFVPGQYKVYKLIPLLAYALLGFVLYRLWPLRNKTLWLILILFNPWVVEHAHQLLTEIPYITLSCLLISGYRRWQRRPRWGWHWLWLVIGTYLLIHLKELGYALLAAILVQGVFRRYRKKTIVLVISVFFLLGADYIIGLRENIYGNLTMMQNQYNPGQGVIGIGGFCQRVGFRLLEYPLNRFPDFFLLPWLHGIDPHTYDGEINPDFLIYKAPIGLIIGLIILRGFWWRWRRGPFVTEVYILFYGVILVIWQSGLPRYLIPIAPFLFGYLLLGTRGLPRNTLWQMAWAIFIILNLSTTLSLSQAAYNQTLLPHWQVYYDASAWCRNNLPPDAVIACRKPTITYLLSDRHTVEYPLTPDPEALRNQIDHYGITHIIVDELATGGLLSDHYLKPALANGTIPIKTVFQTARRTKIVAVSEGFTQ